MGTDFTRVSSTNLVRSKIVSGAGEGGTVGLKLEITDNNVQFLSGPSKNEPPFKLNNTKEHDIDQDDQELIMKLSEMYQQQLAEIKKQEREEGILRERRAMIESILQVRFGELDSELATIIDQVIAMTREEFTPLLLQLSREELLARFTN
ncbi:MAG: hypothetical protein AN482_09565 [Anabaena sp. LE011-02]|nr:MAG: hypothetical protein AN482_09565 [Anabaena sp. LE011-02]